MQPVHCNDETTVMNEPELHHVTCTHPGGLHRMAYWQWLPERFDSTTPVVVCVHGLTRNGRDYDTVARKLAARGCRVICPDIIGRGRSDWMIEPTLYDVTQYVADCVTLVARLDTDSVRWLGTSMGGLIGMGLASLPGNPIERLLLVDVGPVLSAAGINRIRNYVGKDPRFETFEAAEQALRKLMDTFGPHTDAQFRELSRHYFVRKDGGWGPHYDPAIAKVLRDSADGRDRLIWPIYEAIECPVTVLRGDESDLLTPEVAAEMGRRGPKATVESFAGVGHAPTLISDDQIAAVERFLL